MKAQKRRLLPQVFVLLAMLLSPILGLGAPAMADARPDPNTGKCVFKIADQRVGLASSAAGNAENFMVAHTSTEASPLCTVNAGVSFRLYNLYEAVFFPDGSGQARFSLEVFHRTSEGDVLIASQQKTELGMGPRRAVGTVSAPVVLHEPGIYRLAIVATALSDPSSGPEAIDRDEIVVWVLVRDNDHITPTPSPTPTPAITCTPTAEAEVAPGQPIVREPVPGNGKPLELDEEPPAEIVPTDRKMRVAYPRGHFVSNNVAAVENFDQGHGRVLTVRQGDTVTFESAYEFVWFAGAGGSGSTSLSLRYEEAKTGDDPLGEDSQDCQNGLKLAGVLQAPVTFTEAGTFVVVATIDSHVTPANGLQTVTHDQDQVRVTVDVIGEPETGAISGYVTDDVDEQPLERVQIRVLEAETGRVAATVLTNEDGHYIATGLEPAQYLVHADALGQNYLPEWYDDAPLRDDATPVEVVANLTLIGIDFGLTAGASISGQVIEDSVLTSAVIVPIPGTAITVGPLGENRIVAKGITGNDGRYLIDRLQAGSYWVHAANDRAYCLPEYWDDKPTLDTADEVVAVAGKETEDIDFGLQYGGSISGVVRPLRIEPGSTDDVRPFEFRVTAYAWESNEAVKTVAVRPGGSYHLTSLPVGQYAVYAFDPDDQYVPEYYDDVRVIKEATAVSVERGVETKGIDFDLDWAGVPIVEVLPSVQSVMPGDLFTVTINVLNVADLGSFNFDLRFDPAVVAAQGAELGAFLGSTGRDVTPLGPTIDNQTGVLTYGAFSVGDEPGPNGSGRLAQVTLQAVGEGESSLVLADVQLLDTDGQPLPSKSRDGRVSVGGCIFGDFGCDCDVDMLDVMQVALRWGTVEGDPDYDPTYDLDHDGDIDIVDVALVAAAYGNTCDEAVTPAALGVVRGLQADLSATGMRLVPSTAEVQLGQEQVVEVWIDEVQDLAMFEFSLTYDATRLSLSAEDVVLGGFLASTGRSVWPLTPEISVEGGVGRVTVGAASLGAQPAGPNGSGILAQLTFEPVQVGEAELALQDGQWTDTQGNAMEDLALGNGSLTVTGFENTVSAYVPLIQRH